MSEKMRVCMLIDLLSSWVLFIRTQTKTIRLIRLHLDLMYIYACVCLYRPSFFLLCSIGGLIRHIKEILFDIMKLSNTYSRRVISFLQKEKFFYLQLPFFNDYRSERCTKLIINCSVWYCNCPHHLTYSFTIRSRSHSMSMRVFVRVTYHSKTKPAVHSIVLN